MQDTEDGLSEFPHVILNQARVHDFYLDIMRNAPTRLEPDYSRALARISRSDRSRRGSPVTVRLERIDEPAEGEIETVRARYVVGCDGARSAVRKSLGRSLTGDSANQAWGVMDVLAVTDFPDIRLKAAIHSADEGSLLIIPREGGYLVRLYIELDKLASTSGSPIATITIEQLIAAAQPDPASLYAGGEGGRLVVGLRDRPAPLRQVRRRRRAEGRVPRCSSPATPAIRTAPRRARA